MPSLDKTKSILEDYLGTKIKDTGKLTEVLTLLNKFNYLPNLSIAPSYDGSQGSYNILNRSVSLNPSTGKNEQAATHEFTHALDTAMLFLAQDWNKPQSEKMLFGLFSDPATSSQKQFATAYDKLKPSTSNLPNKPTDPYRAGNMEMRAHGVGEMINKGNYPANQHIDPTMATEFDILMDLLRRTGLEPTIK